MIERNFKRQDIVRTPFLCLIVMSFCFCAEVLAERFDSLGDEEIVMIRGDLETITTKELTRVSITNPEVADIANIDTNHILLLARQAGETTLFIWDKYGKRSVVVRVHNQDLKEVKTRIQQLLSRSGIKGVYLDINKLEGKIIVSGELSTPNREALQGILEPFSKDVINLVKEKEETDLIQIDAQIIELNTSLSKSLGIDWSSALTYTETLPSETIHDFPDIFKLGKFSRTTQILSTLNALITEGRGRVLSKPKLVCISGKEASFLVGGEIPITETTSTTGGVVQQNVEFKDFGVGLTVTPTIKEGEKIDVVLTIEVSDVDASNSVGGQPAFTTRNAQTQLFLDNGQTVVLAGLIKNSEGSTVRKVPFLGDIPLAGAFFRSKKTTTPDTGTELVITLTPTILRQKPPIDAEDYRVSKIPIPEEKKSEVKDKTTVSKSQITEGAFTSQTYIPEEFVSYIKIVQERIAQKVVYPERARRNGWEGTVKLALHILNDGTLASASIRESSGHDLFDEDALNLAKSLAPYSNFPSELNLRELTVTIPIIYTLDKNY